MIGLTNIRAAQEPDLPEIVRLQAEAYPAQSVASLEELQDYLSHPRCRGTILVAENAQGVVGFLGYQECPEHRWNIWDLVVRRDHLRKGIATQLLSALKNAALTRE